MDAINVKCSFVVDIFHFFVNYVKGEHKPPHLGGKCLLKWA